MSRRVWARGAVTLALIGGLAAALIASPVGAANPLTKSKAKQIAKKQVNKLTPAIVESFMVVQAQKDGRGVDAANPQTVNTVSITAPDSGFLIIHGQAGVDSDSGAFDVICLRGKVDGTEVTDGGIADGAFIATTGDAACASFHPDDGTGADFLMLNYTVVAPVTAGAHTVTNEMIDHPAGTDWFDANLTVMYSPSGGVSVARQARTAADL